MKQKHLKPPSIPTSRIRVISTAGSRLRWGFTIRVLLGALLLLATDRTSLAGGAFEDLGFGARPVALGRAFVALANDPNALFYNPAGLAMSGRIAVSSMYARLFTGVQSTDLNLALAAATLPLGPVGTVGAAVTNFSVSSYTENMLVLGFGRRLGGRLMVGGTLRFLRWQADGFTDQVSGLRDPSFSYNGYTLDAGVIFDLGTPAFGPLRRIVSGGSLRLGVYGTNLNEPNVSDGGVSGAELPRGFEGGLAYIHNQYVVAVSLSRREKMTRLQGGLEVQLARFAPAPWSSVLVGRVGGVRLLSEGKGGEVAAGAGILVGRLAIDYAYVYPLALRDAGASHKISLGYRL